MAKTREATDITRRNARASKSRDVKLAARLTRIERYLSLTHRGWRRQVLLHITRHHH